MHAKYSFLKKRIWIPIFTAIISFSVFLLLAFNILGARHQQQVVDTTRAFSSFQLEATNLIAQSINLLDGYRVYLETESITEDDSEAYLNRILEENRYIIQNITVIEDTKIKWVYPKEGNEEVIGVDLAEIEEQKEIVLEVKNRKVEKFQGPIELVQGGLGFIVRMPLTRNDKYYGQLSIVVDGDVYIARLRELEEKYGISVYMKKYGTKEYVFGNPEILTMRPLEYVIGNPLFDWEVYVIPQIGWNETLLTYLLATILSIVATIIVTGISVYVIRSRERLENLASKDTLTGLYNRNFLNGYQEVLMTRAERYHRKFGLMLLDLNKFKSINDDYGHKVGDLVLRETAKRLETATRNNEIVIRLGGDEFLIIFSDIEGKEELKIVEERIQKSFTRAMIVSHNTIRVKPSIGYAIYLENGADFEKILHHADQKMYEEKEAR